MTPHELKAIAAKFDRVTHFLDQNWADAVRWIEESEQSSLVTLHLMCVDDNPAALIKAMKAIPKIADIVQRSVILMIQESIHRIGQKHTMTTRCACGEIADESGMCINCRPLPQG